MKNSFENFDVLDIGKITWRISFVNSTRQ